MQAFVKGINIRMGQAHVKRWIVPLDDAPHGYEIFQKKEDNAIKVVLKP